MSTTENSQPQVPIYKDQNSTSYFAEVNMTLPQVDIDPSATYYIQCKYQNDLSGCRPVLHTYHI